MAKKKAAATEQQEAPTELDNVGTKLRKLVIKNFGCIGSTPVEIDLDDVVVLVGRNNTGKSTILRAYQVIMTSSAPKLELDDFPESKVDAAALPEIELHTRIIDNPPASKWIAKIDGEDIVRERWTWTKDKVVGKRQGFDVASDQWSDQVPWGAANVANSRRPRPHRIDAFGSPEEQTEAVVKLLLAALLSAIGNLPHTEAGEDGELKETEYGKLLKDIASLQRAVVEQVQDQIDHAQQQLTEVIQNVFRGYRIEFDAKPEEDITSCLNFFKPGALLRMGPKDGHMSSAERQGSGARRTLMWAALKYAADKKADEDAKPNLLLMDEPELCLHPNAVREACNVLYDLPKTGKWQVMVTTHSPAFIDLSRDNTTVVRVERDADGVVIRGTTVFRPEKAKLSDDEKEELKMLNLCDPSLCEFFFGGRTVIVEGDTEYTAFRFLLDKFPDDPRLKDVHVVRARGKYTICLVAKILNQFNSRYAVLHDCDAPKVLRKKKGSNEKEEIVNPAWTNNSRIRDAVSDSVLAKRARLVALIPHFEGAFFGEELSGEKPVNAWTRLKNDNDIAEQVKGLLCSLLDFNEQVPTTCSEWSDEQALLARYEQFASST
ncbi:glutamine ABC transporter ATP-binding protein [Caulifigura coniformis]|uniref:Glutamine ABC transporter ATP-binding protein n=1 Tax=Caulifigura coniformis TaxID=2527983 RepID=A0A517SHI1_9PLAN|nr:AAA family ATPase [Caulifigura coniformis]QDT55583.1 glutamine ABC transporter ATP-binding protein [Caulifigura coniformis]